MDTEYSVAVQSSDGRMSGVDARPVFTRSGNVRTEINETSNSAIVDFNGREHSVNRMMNPHSPLHTSNQAAHDLSISSRCQNDTLVLSEAMLNTQYFGALESSTQPLSLDLHGDPWNNLSMPSQTPAAQIADRMLSEEAMLSEEIVEELMGIGDIEASVIEQFSSTTEPHSFSYDNSSAQSGYTPAYGSQDNSSMVTGIGAAAIDKTRPCGLSLQSAAAGGMVFAESQAVMVRDIIPPTPTDYVQMEYALFKGSEDLLQPLELPMTSPEVPFPNSVNVQATEESKPKQGSIGEDLTLIKMMKPAKPRPGFVPLDPILPQSQMTGTSPRTPLEYPVQASSPAASVVIEAPSPAPPETPITPAATTKGPFSIRSFTEKECRYFELSVRSDLPESGRMLGLKALFYCFEMCRKFKECMDNPVDLKVANDTSAKLCEFELDSVNNKLIMKMPSNCVPLNKFLKANSDKIDLRGRQLLLQQALNALANIHTGGSDDKMSFWGSFLVWVDSGMNVYLLLDFPVMLAKMEQSCALAGFDPRLQDLEAVQSLYKEMFKPFIGTTSNWPSPGLVKLLGRRFEGILANPSGSKMAEIARNFGERRMCKIEVDMFSMEIVIYCLEHETLQLALSPLENVIPPGVSPAWEVQNVQKQTMVGKEDIAIAGEPMRFSLNPCFSMPLPYREGLVIYSRY